MTIVVKVEKKTKFLGLVFDSKLTWKEHVDYMLWINVKNV